MRRRFRLPLIILLLYSIIVPTIVAASPRPALPRPALNTRVVKGKIRHFVGGAPWVNAEVTFVLEKSSYTPTDQFVPEKFTAKTDSNGDFSVTLVCNNDWQIAVRYRCILPGGDSFTFNLQPGSTPVELSTLRTPVPASAQPSLQAFIDNHADDIATADIPGHIRVGNGLSINPTTGVLSVTGGALSSLSDTQISSPASGQYLRFNGTKWANSVIQASDLPAHTHPDATTSVSGFMSAADKSKLNGVATGATANQTDAFLLSRANHTGTQSSSTISDFSSAVQTTGDARYAQLSGASFTGGVTVPSLGINVGSVSAGTVLDVGARSRFRDLMEISNLAANAYYDAGWKYRANGGAWSLQTYPDASTFNFAFAPAGTAGGTVSWNYTGLSLDTNTGRVGIGLNTALGARLHVNTSFSTTVGQIIQLAASQSADAWQVRNSGGTAVTVFNSAGHLGVGTNNPAYLIHAKTTSGSTFIQMERNSPGDGQVGFLLHGGAGGRIWQIYQPASSNDVSFYDGAADVFRIKQGGNVGIGTINPDSLLHVKQAIGSGIAKLESTGGNDFSLVYANGSGESFNASMTGTTYVIGRGATPAFQPILTLNTAGNANVHRTLTVGGGQATTATPLVINLVASQTGDALQVKDSAGNVGTRINSNGSLQIDRAVAGEFPLRIRVAGSSTNNFAVDAFGTVDALGAIQTGAGFRVTAFGAYMGVVGAHRWIFNNGNIQMLNGSDVEVARFTNDSLKLGSNSHLQFSDSGTRPTCDSTQRGKLWTTFGAAGVRDSHAICQKSAADTFSWVELPN